MRRLSTSCAAPLLLSWYYINHNQTRRCNNVKRWLPAATSVMHEQKCTMHNEWNANTVQWQVNNLTSSVHHRLYHMSMSEYLPPLQEQRRNYFTSSCMLHKKLVNNSNDFNTNPNDANDDQVEHHTRSKEPPTSTQFNSKIEEIIPASGKREASERVHLSIANIATTSHLQDKSSHSHNKETSKQEQQEEQHDAAHIATSNNDHNEKWEHEENKDRASVKSGTIVAPDKKIVESIDQMLATAITQEQHDAHKHNEEEHEELTHKSSTEHKKQSLDTSSLSSSINVQTNKSTKLSSVGTTINNTNIKEEEKEYSKKKENKNMNGSNNKHSVNENMISNDNSNKEEESVANKNTLEQSSKVKKTSSQVTTTTTTKSFTTKAANDASNIPIARVILKVLTYLWPKNDYKIKLLVTSSVMCVLLAKCLKVLVPFWFKAIVDGLAPATAAAANAAAAAASAASTTTTATTSAGMTAGNVIAASTVAAHVGPFTLGILSCVVAYGVCRITASFTEEMKTVLFAPVGGHASTVLAMEMFDKLHNLDLHFHLSRETGVLSKDLDRGSRAFWTLAYMLLFMVIPTGFEMVLVCTALNTQAGFQFIAIASIAVLSYVTWTYVVTNWRARFRSRYNQLDSRLGGLIVDSLLNYETVKYFGSEQYESQRIRKETTNMNQQQIKLDQSMAVLNVGQQLIFAIAGSISLYLATCGVLSGGMTVGDLVLVDALIMQLYMPLSFLGVIYREVQTSVQNMQAMIALLDQPKTVNDEVNAEPYHYKNGTIELRNVCFAYKAEVERHVLRNLSLVIPGGKTVAFVGPSGSGKSTIFRLLYRFYDPSAGQILFDGQPLRSLQMASLRNQIGVIPQDTVLFNESVKYNIRYGRMSATDAEVMDAAKRASLHDTVMKMNNGYDTSVGERGLKLSGGEKQRVAIARVLLADPPILLADEATSALDSTTELNVMRTLKEATQRESPRTIILIAHRLTTVWEADIIFVLDGKGGLAEQGTHYQLLLKRGLYANLWYQQLRERRREESLAAQKEAKEKAKEEEEKKQKQKEKQAANTSSENTDDDDDTKEKCSVDESVENNSKEDSNTKEERLSKLL